MKYIVCVVELVARVFFKGDKTDAYNNLKSCGLLEMYIDNYDNTHTLGAEFIIEEIRDYFRDNGIIA